MNKNTLGGIIYSMPYCTGILLIGSVILGIKSFVGPLFILFLISLIVFGIYFLGLADRK